MFIRYTFLADKVSLDATGKLNALGIFDTIFTTQFPTIHREMTLVAKLEGTLAEKGEHKLSVEFRDADANKLGSFEQKIAWETSLMGLNILKAGVIVEMRGLRFNSAGQYEFVMFLDDRFLGRVPLTVQQIRIKREGEA